VMRAAVYATPAPDSALNRLAAEWLGRDAFTGEATRAPDPARDPLVAEAARYGFHATLRAPFRPRPGVDLGAMGARLAALCAARPAPSSAPSRWNGSAPSSRWCPASPNPTSWRSKARCSTASSRSGPP
jgi:hypothetical protein